MINEKRIEKNSYQNMASDLETKASAENGKSRRSFKKPVSMPDVLSSITAGQVLRQMLSILNRRTGRSFFPIYKKSIRILSSGISETISITAITRNICSFL